MEPEDEPIYGDLEVDDFNKLFRNQNLIKELYGKSIKVRLETSENRQSVTRRVVEDLTRVDLNGEDGGGAAGEDQNEQSCGMYSQAGGALSAMGDQLQDDEEGGPVGPWTEFNLDKLQNHDLKVIFLQLANYCKEFNKTKEEIC